MVLSILLVAVACYFLGNHNGAICVSLMMGDDVRAHGSGNAGLTNFIRSYGTGRALLVILIDVGKAILACLLAGCVLEPYGYGLEGRMLGGMCVMLGHDFPLCRASVAARASSAAGSLPSWWIGASA